MAGNAFKFSIEESERLEELRNRIPKAARILTDIERLAEQVVFPQMRSHVAEVYDEQGDPTGTSWNDYSQEPKYSYYKAALLSHYTSEDYLADDGYPDPSQLPDGNTAGGLMRWKGQEKLWPSLTRPSDPNHIRRVNTTDLSAVYGTAVPYASSLAQTGGRGPFGEPYDPRPILTMPDKRAGTHLLRPIRAWYRRELEAADLL
jgi:hypothetical protein